MTRLLLGMGLVGALAFGTGCKHESSKEERSSTTEKTSQDDHAQAETAEGGQGPGHHEEVSLGSVTIGTLNVSLAQGHGKIEPGKEGHLVVKLPYNDKGATVVRAWLGTEDRTLSFVGRGEYASSHDDYDVHAIAPDPLPKNMMWWVEIERPDGTKLVGAAKPLLD